MRPGFCALLFFIPLIGLSQVNSGRLSELYKYVEQADSFAFKEHKTFFLEKYLKDDHNYRETWRFAEKAGRIIYFQVDYIIDSTEFTEVYYVNRGTLVCSEEYEKVNYTFAEDELKFGSIYYFQSAMPRHIVILGRRTNKYRQIDGETLVLGRFQKRYSELKRHIPMLPE